LSNSELKNQMVNAQKNAEEKIEILQGAEKRLTDQIANLCSKALQENNESFLHTAKGVLDKYQELAKSDLDKRHQQIDLTLKPVKETLDNFSSKVSDLEKARVGAYDTLSNQVTSLMNFQRGIRNALAAPK